MGTAMVTAEPANKLPRFARILWTGILLVNLFVISLVVMVLEQNRQRAIDNATTVARNYTNTLEGNLVGFIRKIDVTLLTTADEVARQKASGGIKEKELNAFLARHDARIPEARGLRVMDVQGNIHYAVNGVKTKGANIGDRPYFIRVRDDPEAGLVFSEPIMGRASNVMLITLSRRINDATGAFAGEVNVAVGIDQFARMFSVLDLGPKGSVGLWSKTGMIARYAGTESQTPSPNGTKPSANLRSLIDSGKSEGTYRSSSVVDGVVRIFAFHQVGNEPLYVVVGLAEEDYLTEWRKDSLRIAGLAGLFVLGSFALLWLLNSAWRRQVAVTEELAHEKEEVRLLNDKLEHRVAQRTALLEAANEELEEFSYSISHDMRTPLRAINGFSKILLDEHSAKLDEEGVRMLKVVRDNARNMGCQIDGILLFLHMGKRTMKCVSIDIARLALEVVAELQAANPARRIRLDMGALPEAWGDQQMIRQVLVSLLSNAIKFSPSGTEAVVELSGTENDNETVYAVKDHGVGFDMQYVDKLFRVFERVHPTGQYEGSGIGLAIVRRIVTRHGGRVWAESKVNEGTTIHFAFPVKAKSVVFCRD
jgi:signal transduction histidine kinase